MSARDLPHPSIPLDPGNGGRSIAVSALRPGDIVVSTTKKSGISFAIRFLTKAEISHAMLYIGGGEVVEAIGEGVVKHKIENALAHATLAIAFRNPTLTAAQARVIVDFAVKAALEGKKYNFWGLVRHPQFNVLSEICSALPLPKRITCRQWTGLVRLGLDVFADGKTLSTGDEFFCSELVAAAYKAAGIDLFMVSANATNPGGIPILALLGDLDYVGHLLANSAPPPPGPDLSDWSYLMSYRPSVCTQTKLSDRGAASPFGWYVQPIEKGKGKVNLDYYPVLVLTMPKLVRPPLVAPRTVTPEELLDDIRRRLEFFIKPEISTFQTYASEDGAKWRSANAEDAVMVFKINVGFTLDPTIPPTPVNIDDADVVTSEHKPSYWIFSPIWTLRDQAHPVSGNRMFGVTKRDDGSAILFTRGVDRATGYLDDLLSDLAFKSANELWLEFQRRVVKYVNDNGGVALPLPTHWQRYDWDYVKKKRYYDPPLSSKWIRP